MLSRWRYSSLTKMYCSWLLISVYSYPLPMHTNASFHRLFCCCIIIYPTCFESLPSRLNQAWSYCLEDPDQTRPDQTVKFTGFFQDQSRHFDHSWVHFVFQERFLESKRDIIWPSLIVWKEKDRLPRKSEPSATDSISNRLDRTAASERKVHSRGRPIKAQSTKHTQSHKQLYAAGRLWSAAKSAGVLSVCGGAGRR